MYKFRPFELQKCDYKSYTATSYGRGINFLPKARSGHRIVASETDIFCFGGYNPDTENNVFPELLKFNVLTKKWSKVFTSGDDKMPKESVSNAVAMKNDVLVLFGGTGYPFGDKRSNKTYLMLPYSCPRKITPLSTRGSDKPEPVYGQAIMLRDNYLYVIGGTTGHLFTCDIYRLNLNTNTWECCYTCNEYLRPDPKGRYRHEIAYDDDYVYIFGGGTQNESFDLETVPAYNFDENKWIYIKTKADPNTRTNGGYPEPRRFHSCIQQDTDDGIEVIIAGGCISRDKYLNDIWKLNLRTHQWQRFAQTKLPYSLYFHDAATTGNGSMYIFGGVTGQTTLRTNDLHKMWTKIPKLSEISWEALIYYRPSLLDKNKAELLEIGVPQKFAERVARGRSVGYIISE